jgi:histidinol-phosphate aminotransferase
MSLFRPCVERMKGYTPGEQPQESGWVKLNTNENPYPCSPRVGEAISRAAGRLNIYPDPLSTPFRKAVSELFGIDPEWIIPANGSDEVLTLLMRTFVDPGETIAYPYPSYVLYESLGEIQDSRVKRILLNPDWSWDLPRARNELADVKLLFVPNPNSPSGTLWNDDVLLSLVPPNGLLVLDEAYGDFRDRPHRMELLKSEAGGRIIVTRTLSKSYSLAGLRLGFAVAHPDLIAGMRKVKDSYNCDMLSLAAGEAAIRDQAAMLANRERILATRQRLTAALEGLGYRVEPSQANFVWATHTDRSHREVYEFLKANRVLVRYMSFPHAVGSGTPNAPAGIDGLRITVGTDEQIDRLLAVLKSK